MFNNVDDNKVVNQEEAYILKQMKDNSSSDNDYHPD